MSLENGVRTFHIRLILTFNKSIIFNYFPRQKRIEEFQNFFLYFFCKIRFVPQHFLNEIILRIIWIKKNAYGFFTLTNMQWRLHLAKRFSIQNYCSFFYCTSDSCFWVTGMLPYQSLYCFLFDQKNSARRLRNGCKI